ADEPRTIVLYEAPHRLARTLADLADALGPTRRVALARELTKLHEEVWRGSLAGAIARAAQDAPRGEYVVVVDGAPAPQPATADGLRDGRAGLTGAGMSTRDASTEVPARFDVPRRRADALATSLPDAGWAGWLTVAMADSADARAA